MSTLFAGMIPPEEREIVPFAYPVCDSTNTRAREWFLAGGEGVTLFASAEQTAGRGRQGKRFYSPSGSGVYFSLAYPVRGDFARETVGATCAAAVAVMQTIRALSGRQTEIKWVNDLLLDGRKVCGILAESVPDGDRTCLILGIGINLRPADFPAELSGIAGSVGDPSTPAEAYIAGTVRRLMPLLRNPQERGWLADYRAHSAVIGREITFLRGGKTVPAQALGIDRDGGLIVQSAKGEEVLRSGEISVRISR